MHVSKIIVPILGLAAQTNAAQPDDKPWEISYLHTFSPPGRPGSSLVYSYINITISDPNDPTVSPANCSTTWKYDGDPYGKLTVCSAVPGGEWAFAMLKSNSSSASPTTDFRLEFQLLRRDKPVRDELLYGSQAFVVGDNMSGLCSAGGICSFGLREDKTPVKVSWKRAYDV